MMTDPHPLGAAALSEAELDQLEAQANTTLSRQFPGPPTWFHGRAKLHASEVVKLVKQARRPTAPSQEGEAVPKPRPYPHATPGTGKVSEYFGFEGGSLTVCTTGYGDADGVGWLCFLEEFLEYEEGERGQNYRIANLDASELIALRDKLLELWPLTPAKPVDGEVERARGSVNKAIWLLSDRSVNEATRILDARDELILNAKQALLVAALPFGGEDMADLSKTDRLSGSPNSNDGWQEIATAPKDGTRIWVGAWLSGSWIQREMSALPEDAFGDRLDMLTGSQSPPTHWRPLPAAPTQGTTPPPSADKSGEA